MTLWLSGINLLCNFDRGLQNGQFCEIILNFEQVVQEEMSFLKIILWSPGGPFVQRSGTICASLVEGFIGNLHVKLF